MSQRQQRNASAGRLVAGRRVRRGARRGDDDGQPYGNDLQRRRGVGRRGDCGPCAAGAAGGRRWRWCRGREHLRRRRRRDAQPGRGGTPYRASTCPTAIGHGRRHRPATVPVVDHFPVGRTCPSTWCRPWDLRDAVRHQQPRQQPHADRPPGPASRGRHPRRRSLQHVLHARRRAGHRRGRGAGTASTSATRRRSPCATGASGL